MYLDGSIVVGFYLDDGKYACFCFSVDASRQVPLVGIGSIGCSGRRYGETVGLRQGYLFVAEQAGSGGESFFRIASGYRLPVAVDAELGGAV